MRICYFGWADHVHLERWAGYFARTGHDVSVLSQAELGEYPAGVRQFEATIDDRYYRLRLLRLRWLLARLNPDIVHVHWAGFAYPFASVWKNRPLVVSAWGSDIYRVHEFPPSVFRNLDAGLRRADLITCDSEDLVKEIPRLLPHCEGKVTLIQWGVDTDVFHAGARNPGFLRELGLGMGPVIFSARNFTPLYNQDVVVRAFAEVHRVRPDAVLIMKNHRGQESYLASIRELIRSLGLEGAVRILDSLPYERMAELYADADVTVSVPSSDGTPMSLLEGMACGSAPIFSDLPSLREWIVDGENGFLVPPQDADMLARRILALLDAPSRREEMAGRNRALVEARASQHFWMGKMEELYRQLLTRTGPR
ncbi:MAG: glycosyltransferase family 4 protein [Rhodocyclaceae bacterium]|nr:glycosyltransferase family 4 protein [Rhodocyclaceae bacterium]